MSIHTFLRSSRVSLLLVALMLLPASLLNAQAVREFQTVLGNTGSDNGNGGIIRAVDGSLIIVGSSDSYGPDNDVYVAKLDACGALIWARTYDIGVDDYGSKLREDGSDSTFVIIGSTSNSGNDEDAFLLKIDQSGNPVWCRTYGRNNLTPPNTTSHDVGKNLRVSEGVIYAIGWTENVGAGEFDGWMWTVTSGGSLIWSYAYGGPDDDFFYGLDWTLDGDMVVVGATRSFTVDRNTEILTVRINPGSGTMDWAFRRGGPGHDYGMSIAVNGVGGALSYIVGRSDQVEYAESIFYATGATAAEVLISSSDESQLMALNEVVISQRKPYAVGYWQQLDGTFDMHVLEFPNASMIPGWSKIYGGSDHDFGYGIVRVYDYLATYDSIAMIGTSRSFGAGGNDIYVVAAYNDGTSGCNEHDQAFETVDPRFTTYEITLLRTDFPQCQEKVVSEPQDDYQILCSHCQGRPRNDRNPGGESPELSRHEPVRGTRGVGVRGVGVRPVSELPRHLRDFAPEVAPR